MNFFTITCLLWVISEITLNVLARSNKSASVTLDKGSINIIWIVIVVSIIGGSMFTSNYPAFNEVLSNIGLVLIIAGIIFRWISIISLGKMFTTNVAIQSGHKLKTDGLYKIIRHPSYTGSLISFLGLGFALGNIFSIIIVFIPILLAFLYRIKVEENALSLHFKEEYEEYKNRTKKLVPYLY
jgi:protein-S-isoprenylcysteine O-methyltransferase Ste14